MILTILVVLVGLLVVGLIALAVKLNPQGKQSEYAHQRDLRASVPGDPEGSRPPLSGRALPGR